jgi:hypothetical protein
MRAGSQRTKVPPAVRAAAERGTRGAGGRLPHLDKIQKSFGAHDVSGIRAYTGAAATAASFSMGASAFAWGDKVGFAGAPSLRTAAHEAAHVVQQRAGVHVNSGVGEMGDRYEQQADAVAEQVVQGKPAEGLLGPVANGAGPASPVVQRSVGFEFELRAGDWNIWTDEDQPKAPAKGTRIIYGQDFTLQAEYSGEKISVAELVTDDPGLQTRDQFEASVKDMQRLGRELDAVPANTSRNAGAFTGGDPDFKMEKKENASIDGASLQVTAGVPLGSVHALFSYLEGVVPESERGEYQQARERALLARGERVGSNEFLGLMVLLQQYLSQLQGGGAVTKNYVKGMIKVMARTDFHAMFGLMPETDQTWVKNHMDDWIRAMLSGKQKWWQKEKWTTLPEKGRLVSPIISDPGSQDPAMQITTTRKQWLKSLPQRDLLSYSGRETGTEGVEVFPKRSPGQIAEQIKNLPKETPQEEVEALQAEYTEALKNQDKPVKKRFGKAMTPEKYYGTEEGSDDDKPMIDAMKSLYMGLGSLGGRMDYVEYEGEEQAEGTEVNAENFTGAPVIEIRNPPNAGKVDNWFTVAESIYNAVDDAIKYPNGKDKAPRDYRNVLSPGQVAMQNKAKERAKALSDRLLQLDEEME